jgi:hypothetical protein
LDDDREHWSSILSDEAPDAWPEAKELADRAEAKLLADRVEFRLVVADLAGQKDIQKRVRARLLHECFGVMDKDLLVSLPVARLRQGLTDLEQKLQAVAEAA